MLQDMMNNTIQWVDQAMEPVNNMFKGIFAKLDEWTAGLRNMEPGRNIFAEAFSNVKEKVTGMFTPQSQDAPPAEGMKPRSAPQPSTERGMGMDGPTQDRMAACMDCFKDPNWSPGRTEDGISFMALGNNQAMAVHNTGIADVDTSVHMPTPMPMPSYAGGHQRSAAGLFGPN